MSKFSQLRIVSIVLILAGLIFFGVGYFQNHSLGEDHVTEMMNERPELFGLHASSHAEVAHDAGHEKHMNHLVNQLHNRPWAAALIAIFMFTGISAASLFFLCIQHASQAGWPVVMSRVMEAMASFLPVGAIMLFAFLAISAAHGNHMYHWMVEALTDLNSPDYDKYIDAKSVIWLDAKWWIARAFVYLTAWSFFSFKIKALSKKLDETKSPKDYLNLYNWSVGFIAVFAVTSAAAAFDWIMSIDPHWYSTLFMWYNMVSYLVCAVSIMAMISIYLKNKGLLPAFSKHHQHDLAKYMFGFSMLWTYLWFCQFLLIWYANIPEEAAYFLSRYDMYRPTYFTMLIPNFAIPFLFLVSSIAKRISGLVIFIGFIIIIGHYLDFFNQVMPGSVGPFWHIGLYEIGALLFVIGLFIMVVFYYLSKLNLEAKGNPFYHESKIYEYPF